MQAVKVAGRHTSALKYDILSALGVLALGSDKHRQRLILRLMVLITTRYNWQSNELSIGRAEIARLWSVDERTVKREMAKLRALDWVQIKRPAARGRVAVYAINLAAILGETRPVWDTIGTDFDARMQEQTGTAPSPKDPKVVPFQRKTQSVEEQGELWGAARALLETRDPTLTQAWFAGLTEAGCEDGVLTLMASSRFVADYVRTHHGPKLLATVSQIDPTLREVRLCHDLREAT